MTSQNKTLRCAASTMYSMAGANMPNGVNASVEDGCFWLAGMLSAPFTTSGNRMGVNADKKIQMPAGRTAIEALETTGCQTSRSNSIPSSRCRRSAPLERHGDVTRHTAGKIDDLDPELVSAGMKILCPELIDFFWYPGERGLPARLLLIDGATLIRAQVIGKAVHLHLGLAVLHCAFDDLDGATNGLLVGNARRLPEAVDQRVLLGIALGKLPRVLGCLFRLRERKLFHVIACAGQQLVGFARHGSPNS